jgi:hypothetical protein
MCQVFIKYSLILFSQIRNKLDLLLFPNRLQPNPPAPVSRTMVQIWYPYPYMCLCKNYEITQILTFKCEVCRIWIFQYSEMWIYGNSLSSILRWSKKRLKYLWSRYSSNISWEELYPLSCIETNEYYLLSHSSSLLAEIRGYFGKCLKLQQDQFILI